jgi:heptosyltransferase-1
VPNHLDLNRIERLLILKISSMGDIVHASPVAAALKRAFPHLRIGWVAEDRHAGVLDGSPAIDRLHVIPYKQLMPFAPQRRSWWQALLTLSKEIRAERYQVALDLQGLFKSAIWGVLGGVPIRLGAHRMREGTHLLMKRLPIPDRPDQHVVLQYLEAARWLGAEPLPVEFPLFIPTEAYQRVQAKLAALGVEGAYISINPSAGREWKRWHIAKFAELSDRIEQEWGLPVVFIGGPGDKPLEQSLLALKRRPLRSLIGQTSLKEAMAAVVRSAVHVCGDTGTAHIAAAFNTPCVALYGPTNPDRTGPFGQRERVLSKRTLCRQCPPDRCVRRECLQWITVDEVLDQIAQAIAPEPSML